MRLCEEYVRRHALSIPLIIHAEYSAVFYQQDESWLIHQADWHPPEIHPGHYSFRVFRPVHNGFERGRTFERIKEDTVQWDEYEPRLIEWSRQPRIVAKTKEEVLLASWEILLRCWDKALVRHIHMDDLLQSLDSSATPKTRCEYVARCVESFSKSGSDCHRTWTTDLEKYRENYAYWLAQLAIPPQ